MQDIFYSWYGLLVVSRTSGVKATWLLRSALLLFLREDQEFGNSFKVRFICGGMIFGLIFEQHDYSLLLSLSFLLNHLLVLG